jgi:hypothetical protein
MSEFSYASYFAMLDAWAERFAIKPLRTFPGPGLYLRHDIDVCPRPALEMASREAERGIASTYMFIPTSPLYTLSEDVLRPFVDLGHEVAIHFDYLTSNIEPDNIEPAVREQCDFIARLTGEPVRSISFHRPIPAFLRGPDYLFGMVNAYSATLMTCYRSDSAGRWRQDPFDIPHVPVAQLLTHPIWWSEEHGAPGDRLRSLNADEQIIRETVPGVAW